MRPRLVLLALALLSCSKEEPARPAPKSPEAVKPPEATPPPPSQPEVIKLEGFQTPESARYDDRGDLYLVSNINGSPFDKDDNGFIARVSPPPGAKRAEAPWIDGKSDKVTLHAPKGMAFLGDVLYVADIDTVRLFDRTSGEPKGEIAVPGAVFLNDVTAGDGVVYVSDSGLDAKFQPTAKQAIWELRDGKPRKLASGMELGGPNGLAVTGGALWVVTFGSGELYQLGADGKRASVEKLPKGGLDGLVIDGKGRFFVSSWEAGTIYLGQPGGPWTPSVINLTSPADIEVDSARNLVIVPIFQENRVEMHEAARGG